MHCDYLQNEQELVKAITQGDEHAFAKLFDHYRNKIYGIALKLTHSTTVAEEITEDVFLKIWLRRSTLNEIKNFSAYLFAIARNETYKILKQIAKSYRVILLTENQEAVADENAEDYLMGKEYTTLLQKAIKRLPRQQRQVYQLVKEEDLKRTEVAEILQIQPETVKFHLAQAMKNIRAFMNIYLNLFIGFSILFHPLFLLIEPEDFLVFNEFQKRKGRAGDGFHYAKEKIIIISRNFEIDTQRD